MSTRGINSAVYGKFYAGQTGLVAGDFTAALSLDGGTTSETLTITEDALGWYNYTFTGLSSGQYLVKISYSSWSILDEYTYTTFTASDIQPLTEIHQKFYVGVTGLTQASFTAALFKNNVASAVSFVITEDSLGWYDVSFVEDSDGDWLLRIDYGDYHYIISAFVGAIAGTVIAGAISSSLGGNAFTSSISSNNFTTEIR